MKNLLNVKATDIIIALSFFALSVAVVLLVKSTKYDSAVAVAAIMVSIIIPFATKNLELEKHHKQFLYEKKYNAYVKYLNIFDDYWNKSQEVLLELNEFNQKKEQTREEFEEHKLKLLESYKEFVKIKNYLSMPGLEILIFINQEIADKINEIVSLEEKESLIIKTDAELKENSKKIEKYIKVLSELAKLLSDDLGIKEKK